MNVREITTERRLYASRTGKIAEKVDVGNAFENHRNRRAVP